MTAEDSSQGLHWFTIVEVDGAEVDCLFIPPDVCLVAPTITDIQFKITEGADAVTVEAMWIAGEDDSNGVSWSAFKRGTA